MKKRVGILYGGYSSEAHISEKSGKVVQRCISDAYDAILVQVSTNGMKVVEDNNFYNINLNDLTYEKGGIKLGFDVMFNAIHGTPGEDGTIQGFLEMVGMPFTGSGVLPSALSFDKGKCNTFFKDCASLNIAKSVVLSKGKLLDTGQIKAWIGIPCFVKPCNAGSSYGISRVNSERELLPAIEHAFSFDDSVLVEQYIEGTEVSNGVYSVGDEIHSLPLTEIVPEGSFFDYSAKYEGKSQEITPARISNEVTELVQGMSRTAFELLGLKGMARIDFIIKDGTPYLIEVNTIPGLSEESILPQQVKQSGMTLSEFFGKLIDDALAQTN